MKMRRAPTRNLGSPLRLAEWVKEPNIIRVPLPRDLPPFRSVDGAERGQTPRHYFSSFFPGPIATAATPHSQSSTLEYIHHILQKFYPVVFLRPFPSFIYCYLDTGKKTAYPP